MVAGWLPVVFDVVLSTPMIMAMEAFKIKIICYFAVQETYSRPLATKAFHVEIGHTVYLLNYSI